MATVMAKPLMLAVVVAMALFQGSTLVTLIVVLVGRSTCRPTLADLRRAAVALRRPPVASTHGALQTSSRR